MKFLQNMLTISVMVLLIVLVWWGVWSVLRQIGAV